VIFDVQVITPYARQMAGVIQKMAGELQEIVAILRRPKNITPRLVEIHRLENEGDDIYQRRHCGTLSRLARSFDGSQVEGNLRKARGCGRSL